GTTARSDARRVGRGLPLGLGLELGVVFPEERLDLVAHREQLRPLLLVERHRKAAEPVDRDAAFLAHLEADAAPALRLEPLVLGPELFEFRPEIFVCHVGVARNVNGSKGYHQEPRATTRPPRNRCDGDWSGAPAPLHTKVGLPSRSIRKSSRGCEGWCAQQDSNLRPPGS